MMAALARYRALLRGDSIGDPAELARLAADPGPPHRGQGLGLDSRSEGGPAGSVAPGHSSLVDKAASRPIAAGCDARRSSARTCAAHFDRERGRRLTGSRSAVRR